jgi:predicted Zn-dependent protease
MVMRKINIYSMVRSKVKLLRKIHFVWLIGLLLLTASCSTAPYTGRRQLMLSSSSQENSLGYQSFNQILQQYRISKDPQINAMVSRVGERIAAAAARPDFRWEFVVLQDDKMVNAFCLPGGKVGVFTGILKYTQDEAGLATVISHEAAHAILRHAGERMSQSTLAQIGGLGLGIAMQGKSPYIASAAQQAYGLGATVGVILPYSRKQEYEADRVGLILMAKAGYDPSAALGFWERMMAGKKGKEKTPEFLSTHPADAGRIREIQRGIAEAGQYYTAPVKKAQNNTQPPYRQVKPVEGSWQRGKGTIP